MSQYALPVNAAHHRQVPEDMIISSVTGQYSIVLVPADAYLRAISHRHACWVGMNRAAASSETIHTGMLVFCCLHLVAA